MKLPTNATHILYHPVYQNTKNRCSPLDKIHKNCHKSHPAKLKHTDVLLKSAITNEGSSVWSVTTLKPRPNVDWTDARERSKWACPFLWEEVDSGAVQFPGISPGEKRRSRFLAERSREHLVADNWWRPLIWWGGTIQKILIHHGRSPECGNAPDLHCFRNSEY